MMEIKGLHPQLSPMVVRGQLSGRKIASLIELGEIVDRFATVNFVSDEEIVKIEQRYGAKPEIISWSDYFQTEVASRYFELSDDEFVRVIDTIRFDLISAVMIFRSKQDTDFMEQIRVEALVADGIDRENWTEKEEQASHMGVLLQYFEQMGLADVAIQPADQNWFESFIQSASMPDIASQAV